MFISRTIFVYILLYIDFRLWISGTTAFTADESTDGSFPLLYDLTITTYPSEVKLRLKRSLDAQNIPVFMLRNGNMFKKRLPYKTQSRVYTDMHSQATITVSCINSTHAQTDLYQTCPHPVFHGTFLGNNSWYSLQHDLISDSQSHLVSKRSTGQGPYHLLRLHDSSHYSNVRVSYRHVSYPRQQRRSARKIYSIETVYVVSYDIYKRWLKRSRKHSRREREKDATYNIQRYFTLLSEGVNLRYVSVDASDFTVYIRIVAVIIATTGRDSPWTEDVNTGRGVEGTHSLPLFSFWAYMNKDRVVKHDHMQLVTGYNVLGYGRSSTLGLAYSRAMCRGSRSVSMIEDIADIMKAITVSAHEIGHSIGMGHDGRSNACNSRHNYIMSTSISKGNFTTKTNPWSFSTCSIHELRKHLSNYEKSGLKCLDNQPKTTKTSVWKKFARQLPGQVYSPDDQCRLIYGDFSHLCRSVKQAPSDICTHMWCTSGYRRCQRHHAARGTSCGNKRWCIDGFCKYDAKAPKAKDSCLYGDTTAEVFTGWSCGALLNIWPFLCQWDFHGVHRKCCGTCRQKGFTRLIRRKRSEYSKIEKILWRIVRSSSGSKFTAET